MSCNEYVKSPLGIVGVFTQPLNVIDTPGGVVLHMLRSDYALMPHFEQGFGEIYFSEVLPGHVKGWKRHSRQTQLFAVPVGLVHIVMYDSRMESATHGMICELILGRPDNYRLLQIPPGIWYSFAAVGGQPAIICNCANLPHDPEESEKLPLENEVIPYFWGGK